MGIQYLEEHACLEGTVTVDDAEALSAWLLEQPKPAVHLGNCTHLHSAVLQVLLALRPVVLVPPPDPMLSQVLAEDSAASS